MIRRDLPGWYPTTLLPELRAAREAISGRKVTGADCDLLADRLAEVLRRRPEPRGVARAPQRAPARPAVRGLQPMDHLPETVVLPERLQNECEVLVRQVIEALPEPEPPAPAAPRRPHDRPD
jgi:hypothetical protein